MYSKFDGGDFEEPVNYLAREVESKNKPNRAKELGPLETSIKENQSV